MDSVTAGQPSPCWPVIVHTTLGYAEYANILRQKKLKLRVSESVVPGSIIFPQSGVAFMVIPLAKAATSTNQSHQPQLTEELTERLDKFTKVHRNCYALCEAPLHGPTERNVFSLIQRRYMFSKLHLIPTHSPSEGVHTMLTIAKALCKPVCEVLSQRLDKVFADTVNVDIMPAVLSCMGLNDHCQVMQDGLGSLAKLSTATRDELLDCSLDSDTVAHVLAFFNEKQEE